MNLFGKQEKSYEGNKTYDIKGDLLERLGMIYTNY